MSAITLPVSLPNSEDSQPGMAEGDKSKRRNGRKHAIPTEDDNTSNQGKRKRAQNACTTCRQQKLRCDGPIKFPAPCSRCMNHGLQCRVDPSFKRTPARQQLEQVSKQLEHMREKLKLRSAQSAEGALGLEVEPKSECYTPAAPIFPVLESSLLPKKIGDIELVSGAIVTLFHEFYLHYHPHLPIVDTTDPVETIFVESPLLFSTILCIACRYHPTYSNLHKRFIPPLNVLISGFPVNPNGDIINKGIQALLLLCSWPLPFERQADDPSWLRCGMATHLALQNGFHRPGFAQEFKREKLSKDELRGRTVTWLACFVTDFSLSTKLGLPPTVTPDFTIRTPPSDIPENFKQHLQIVYTCSKFFPALSNNQFTATGLIDASSRWSLVQLFDGELETLYTQLSQATLSCPLPAESDIILLTSWLHLQTYALQEDIQNVVGTLETSGMMIKGFRTAVKLIDVISNEHRKDILKFYPTYITRSLVTAALWLLKLIAVSGSRKSAQASKNLAQPHHATTAVTLLDTRSIDIAENHIREVFIILLKLSISGADEFQRAARFIEIMGGRGDGKHDPARWGHSIKTRSRMGSMLFYDAMREVNDQQLCLHQGMSQEDASLVPSRDQQKDLQNGITPPTTEPDDTCNRHAELDTMLVDQGVWSTLEDLEGFGAWDNSWDNGFGFLTPLDS